MDLSKLNWLKNVKPDRGWAYEKSDMAISEAKIFRLHWRNNKDDAQRPLEGDLIALVQHAKVTHIVELLDDMVYGDPSKDWNIFRVVKAVWMPPETINWENLPHSKEIFGVERLPPNGRAYDLRLHQIERYWENLGGLDALQKECVNILSQVS